MSTKIINGKKPLSAKPQGSNFVTEDIFGNTLALPEGLAKTLEEQGLEARWVNAKQLYANQGYHNRGWVVYKQASSGTIDNASFLRGNDPDGLVRRGDCILAVKKIEAAEKHRQYLKDKAERQNRTSKDAASELRQMASAGGVKTQIHEGYDEDGDEE